jgi:hypothetical protein
MGSVPNHEQLPGPEDAMTDVAEHLEHELQQKSDRLASLVRTTTAVACNEDLGHVLQTVGFEVARFLPLDRVAVYVIQRGKGTYKVLTAAGGGKEGEEGASDAGGGDVFPLAGSAVELVAKSRRPLLRPQLGREPDAESFPEEKRLAYEGMRSCAMVPMIGREGVAGVFLVAGRESREYSDDDRRFLELIAEQLTAAVEREKHLRQLKKRHGKLAIINEIGRKAMAQFDMIDVLDSVTNSIQHYFGYYDVSIFLVDDSVGDVVLMAQAGAYRELTTVGYRQKLGVGLVGLCAATGETIVANDVSKEPRRVIAFPGEAALGSEACVAVQAGENIMGVINVECREVDAFDEEDINALETFAGQIAQTIENARLYEETRLLKEFNENIIANMPAALVVVDTDYRVQIVNETYCRLRQANREDVIGSDIAELFSTWFLREGGLNEAIRSALDTGESVAMRNVKGVLPPAVDHLFNVHVSSIGMGTQQCAMIMLEDVSQTVEHAYQLSMLRQINEAVQTTLDLKRLLRLVLACTTSGHALGFNRAILLMVNKAENTLEGRLALGPRDREDAHRIWQQMSEEQKSFKELLREADDGRPDEEMPLYHIAARLKLPLDSDELVVRSVREKTVAIVDDAHKDDRVSEDFLSIVGASRFVCVPLIAKDEAVGAVVVDNLYSGEPITPDRIELLTIFANHVGLAIENAEAYEALHRQMSKLQEAYRELREAQGKLVQSEKLAAIGEVAAHVAHEIRNPLVTIGGFARNIKRQLPEDHPCTRSIDIIVDEVRRLEKILANVMDFSKPSAPWKRPTKINQVVRNTCVLVGDDFESRNITFVRRLAPDLPLVMVDAEQIKQALLNILKNAAESIGTDGQVTVSTRLEEGSVWIDISDTGKGIPEDTIANLFDPFFTTRPDGTGLGLAVTRKIIVDHGGDIEVKSKLGIGTTFTITLPADVPAKAQRQAPALEKSHASGDGHGGPDGSSERGGNR